MSKRSPQESSELVQAAAALEQELKRFESLAEEIRDTSMHSQKQLERMARAMGEVADADERLVAQVRALLAALNVRRDRQQALAADVNARAQELQQRTAVYQELMQRFAAIGQEAGGLSTHVQELFGRMQSAQAQTPEELIGAIHSVCERMAEVAESAHALSKDAQAQEFTDVARDADSLRQQLLSARNRASLLQQKLHPANA
jgi:hypothetical protein